MTKLVASSSYIKEPPDIIKLCWAEKPSRCMSTGLLPQHFFLILIIYRKLTISMEIKLTTKRKTFGGYLFRKIAGLSVIRNG